jgi:putative aldouronate transport system permease protein
MAIISRRSRLTSRKSRSDIVFDILNVIVLTLLSLCVLYPVYFMVIASVSDPVQVDAGKVWLFPEKWTLTGYHALLNESTIWRGYLNTILYAVLSVAVSVPLTLMAAYPLSRRDFVGRRFFMLVIVFTLFFGGGLIPTYMVVRNLHMLNTVWAMVIPGAVSVWNVILARTFFQTSVPQELMEAAFLDGCSNTGYFWRILVPLSKPIIAVITLFTVVGIWNSYFDALIYLNDKSLYPLQLVLREILIQSQPTSTMNTDVSSYIAQEHLAELIKYGAIIVASIPLLILYPFLQRFFAKGALVGSLKE